METFKQKIARIIYPFILKIGKRGKNGTILANTDNIVPSLPLNLLDIVLNNGKNIDLTEISGKKILIVNTASNCGYTKQYAELQSLFEMLQDQLLIIAFPANDFGGQESGNNENIINFCQVNYGVTFPVAKKSVVVRNDNQHEVFKWLTNMSYNGWNNHAPDWNFSKYLIDEEGNLTHYFGPSVSPLDEIVLKAIK